MWGEISEKNKYQIPLVLVGSVCRTWFMCRIQNLKRETELLEVQCEAVQQEFGWQYLILKQVASV
jgi:hypothetical protein